LSESLEAAPECPLLGRKRTPVEQPGREGLTVARKFHDNAVRSLPEERAESAARTLS
jgi:hypothetical protein